jgi:hypothetical protein
LLVPSAIFAVLLVGAGIVSPYTGEELAKDAKVTLAEARAIALKAFPGLDSYYGGRLARQPILAERG